MKLFVFAVLLALVQFTLATQSQDIRIASYNTGLVPGDNAHLPDLINVIPRNLDVLALQEVWLQSDIRSIVSALNSSYPYSYYPTPDAGSKIGCKPVSAGLSTVFFTCLATHGISTVGWDTITPCLPELRSWMSQDYDCALCFISSISAGISPESTGGLCFTGQGYPYTYGGSSGLLVLSKTPIKNANFTARPSFLLRRGLLEMCVKGLYIVESHYPFEYPLPLLQELQTDFSRHILKTRPNIVLGDLNTGKNYQPAGYELLKSYGYKSINPDLATYCITNSSIAGSCNTETELRQKIDHIMYDNEINCNSLEWQRRTQYEITTFGSRAPTVSDHIGISSTLKYKMHRPHIYCR